MAGQMLLKTPLSRAGIVNLVWGILPRVGGCGGGALSRTRGPTLFQESPQSGCG